MHDSFVIEYNKQAIHYIENNHTEKAGEILRKAKDIIKTERIRNLALVKSFTCFSYGLLYKTVGKLNIALRYFLESLEIAKNGKNNQYTLPRTHLQISLIYACNSQYEKALPHALEALRSCKTHNVELLDIYHCIGDIYKHQRNYLGAMKYFLAGSDLSKKMFGESCDYTLRFTRDYQKIARKTNLQPLISTTPKPRSSIHDFIARISPSQSPFTSVTPPPFTSPKRSRVYSSLTKNI